MQKLYRFWQKDLTNKLIVLVMVLIAAAIALDLFLLLTPKTSGTSLLADLFPSPTTDLKFVMTSRAETAIAQAAMATASVPPTITTIPLTPRPMTATFTPTPVTPSPTFPLVITTEQPTATQTPGGTPAVIPTSTPGAGSACLPGTAVQPGKVVDIVDGVTIKVLVDGLVYTVRYIGLALPTVESIAGQASVVNGQLVYGKEITLVSDGPDKDNRNRLLRYVKVGETFINYELLWQGLAIADENDPQLACAQAFLDAQKSAKDAQRGIWKFAPVP